METKGKEEGGEFNSSPSTPRASFGQSTFIIRKSTHASLPVPAASFLVASKSTPMTTTRASTLKSREMQREDKGRRGNLLLTRTKLISCDFIIGFLLLTFMAQAGAEWAAVDTRESPSVRTLASLSSSSLSTFSFDDSSTTATIASSLEILDGILDDHNGSSTLGPSVVSDDPCCNSTLLYNQTEGQDESWQLDNNYSTASNGTVDDGNHLYDVPVYLVALLSLLYGVISITAVIGNFLVLWVVTLSRRMRTKTNLFIANLACADIIIALFAIPFQFQAALSQRWDLPEFMCAFCPFVQVVSVNVSVFTLSAIALDRYRAIIYPFKAIQISKREAILTVIFIWCISIALAIPQELDYRVIDLADGVGATKPFCAPVSLSSTFRTYYSLGLAVIQYVLPLLIISVAYTKMAAKLWGSSAPGNKEESRDENTLRNKKKVVKMLAIVIVLFGLCWLPLQTYNFLQTITTINEYQYINIIWFCFHWLAMSNSCYNPFIYAIYSDKFQTEFRLRLHCLQSRNKDTDDSGSDGSDYDVTRSSRIRVAPARFSRVCHQNRRTVGKMSSIESSRTTELEPMHDRTYIPRKHAPISTICNNIKTTEAILTSEFSRNCSIEST